MKAFLQARRDLLRLVGVGICLGACLSLTFSGCEKNEPTDEAKAAAKTTADFPQITADIFKPMDGGVNLSPEEIMGRNTWNLWSAGNQHFWNRAAQDSYGLMDLLKMLDSRKYPRGERFKTLGLVNEPGFRAATKPDKFGLWLDEQVEPEPAGIDETVYGKSSGVLGFRIFPNPDFNEEKRKKWDGDRFMNDASYYNDNKLVRPYRVGVACGACHIAPYPDNPPADPENPRWENLASAIGNQYINEGKVFACNVEKGGFFYEMLVTQPRGTSDTSRIATDHINNPNAINPIFLLGERERIAVQEKMTGGTLALPGEKEEMPVPHVLKDGADSIGVAGATIRVYVNIGMFSEYWLTLHNRLIGLTPQKPFEISYAREHSVFWRATEERLANIAAFFRRLKPFHLADAPGGQAYMTADSAVMTRGKEVFAESCAACHSSKQPPPNVDPRSGEGKAWFRTAVMAPDFLENNFLSNDKRYPLTKIETNSARAFATNAKAGHVWDNFSSQTYKELSPVDELEFFNPFDETRPIKFNPKDKNVAPGYYRTPSLVSLWSSAPFLHNNMLGKFTGDPSVAGRMEAFNDAVEKLLWPEKRLNKASIWRTQNECALHLRKEFVPKPLQALADKDGYINIGPIPKDTPINLIANLEPDFGQLIVLQAKIAKALLTIHTQNLSSEQATDELIKAVPELLAANKCPDFVEDKGHYFGTDLPDNDKRALIEYLKTL
ncbi:MAG TPA: cytochrome c [Candidatus Dormibacteraeota bacterium]|nr:cytochrome c [Candidatus Dormibacteraeota bacterium]